MTIEHIVLLEKKDDATDDQTQAALAGIKKARRKFRGAGSQNQRQHHGPSTVFSRRDYHHAGSRRPWLDTVPIQRTRGSSTLATRRRQSRRGGHRDLISLIKSADQVMQSQFFIDIGLVCGQREG